ncbi:MAG: hypothetical protein KY455_03480 [Euryarchaeota archaeon]|nr:hypothetical protein [Euryarchaeota archaeon]
MGASAGVLYEEHVPTASSARAVLLVVAGILITVGWIVTPGETLLARTFFRLFTLGAAGTVLWMGWWMREIVVRVDANGISLEQGRFHRELPFDKMRAVEAAMAGGNRVRVPGKGRLRGSVLCLNRRGPAVVVHRDDGAPFVFSSRTPHAAVEVIEAGLRRRHRRDERRVLDAEDEPGVVVLEAA